jgi:hypothetical protein
VIDLFLMNARVRDDLTRLRAEVPGEFVFTNRKTGRVMRHADIHTERYRRSRFGRLGPFLFGLAISVG